MPKAKHGWRPEEIPNQKRLFCVLIILRHLLDGQRLGDAWQREVSELLKPVADFQPFRIAMGLPEDWQGHPRWRRGR